MAAAAPAAAPPPAGDVYRDHHGFLVKPEFSGLYTRFAPLYEAEERERSEKWAELMGELAALVGRQPGEGDAALLQRALAHLTDTTASGAPPPQAAALLQRVASLVQAGLPMRTRGDFWRLFLNVDAKRTGKEAEYERLCGEVEQLEALAASTGDAAAAAAEPAIPPLPGAAKVAAAAAAGGGPYSLVADGTAAAAAAAAARLHRIDVFQITALDESPEVTPAKQPSSRKCDKEAAGEEGAPGTATATQAVVTPASTLLTPQAYSTASSSSCGGASDGLPTAATPHTSGSVAYAGGDAACATGGSLHRGGMAGVGGCSPSSIARTAERWRQGEILSQIDKDLHRTFPGHPALDQGGRAMLRRILGAYARRNPAVGYCQGLNFLAATLMLWMPEEDAFWCLCAVIEDILGCSYFDERMVLPQVDVLVFGHLLQGRFPTLWRHLQALEVDAGSVTMHWFLCCFLNSLPLDSALRVWDLLFFEGSAVVLFRCALALIEIYDQALMCCRESSDGYMLLQSCAQMTYDSSRLVDTACIGYSHLQPAGLCVLRQRYRPAVLENLRGAFAADGEYDEYVRSQQNSPESVGAAPPTFADAFQRVSSAVLEAEEAAARAAQNTAADGGHLSLRGRGGSRRGSPGGGSGGSQPASPLARVRQAVSGLTSRLVPSSLPQLLPAGALDASGQELSPMSSGSSVGPSPLRAHPARQSNAPGADAPPAGQQQGAVQLRRISVGERQRGTADGGSSPGSSGSAGSGAVLRRQPPGLTPFGSAEVLLGGAGAESGSQQQGAQPAAAMAVQQQQQQHGEGSAGPAFGWTPPRPGPARGVMPWGHGPAAVAQSQPATPSALLPPVHPPGTQRRAMTFGATGSGHTRRRRRLTIDLLSLANLRPDLHQPGVAAALAIAANPSPHAARAAGAGRGFEPDGSLAGSLQPSPLGGPHDDGSGGVAEGAAAGGTMDVAEELLLPIRALRFDDAASGITEGDEDGAEDGSGSPHLHLPGPVRRANTAPVWLACVPAQLAAVQPSIDEELPVSSSAQRLSSSGDSLSSGEEAAGMGASGAAPRMQRGTAVLAAAAPASSAEEGQDSSSGAASSSLASANSSSPSSGGVIPAAWSPGGGGSTDVARPLRASPVRGSGQSRQALLDVVAQLQAEVAVAESRRHEVEQAAEEAHQTVQDLRRQVDKVQALAASKEALIAELSAKLQASSASAAEADGALAAARMAVEGEEAELERTRRQLGAADALVQRLMAAVAERGRASPSKRPFGATAAELAHSSATTSSCGSPQSSIGSVAPRAR